MPKLKDKVELIIRSMLFNNELEAGDTLSDFALSRQLGVSRTPVRQAIQQLVRNGLVEYRSGTGYFVRLPSRKEIEELYDLRDLLESYAASKAATEANAQMIERIERICKKVLNVLKTMRDAPDKSRDSDYGRTLISADMEFHRMVVEASGSNRTSLFSTIGELSLIVASLGHIWKEKDRDYWKTAVNSFKGHLRIFKAIKNHDSEAAKQAMHDHLSKGKDSAIRVYNQRHAELLNRINSISKIAVSKLEQKRKDDAFSKWDELEKVISR